MANHSVPIRLILSVMGAVVFPFLAVGRGFGRAVSFLLGSFRFWVGLGVVGIAILAVYYALADRYTPLTSDAFVQAYVTQVAAQVEGQVISVHVRENQKVHRGDLLFELDPRPFEHILAALRAKLVQAENRVAQMESELLASKADDARMDAEEEFARVVLEQEKEIFRQNSTTQRKYLDALQKHQASLATRDRGKALTKKAEIALAARLGNEHALVAEVKAQLAEAALKLSYCRVLAPCDGIITNLQLREGAYAHVGQAVLACIDTQQWVVVANFREKCLERMKEGQPALVAFQVAPGKLFPARVQWIGWGVAQGQGSPSGLLPEVRNQSNWIPSAQRFQVRLMVEEGSGVEFRVGLTGSVSVYHDQNGFLNSITKNLHKIISLWYYL